MKLALIGCGQVVERYHLPALSAMPQVQVGCIVEASDQRRREIALRFPGVLICGELDEALSIGAADAALIATPPTTHADLAQRCLAAGWDVLIEKPMARSLAEAGQILAAASRSGKQVAIGFNRRFRRSWTTARRLLAPASPDAWQEMTLTLGFDTTRWSSAASLDHEDAALAGLLDDVIPHQADLLAFLFGCRIVQVRADELRFRRGHSAELTYMAQLLDGPTIRCSALHMPGHLELLEARRGGRAVAVTPDAVIEGDFVPILRRRCADAWDKVIGACHRMRGRPSTTVASFIAQHRAFQAAVLGGPSGALADGAAGAAACAVGDALGLSILADGAQWTDVAELTG